MRPQMLLGICLCLLLAAVSGQNWQSHGNFSESNLTLINSTIKAAVALYQADTTSNADLFCKNISDTLNAAWETAWNVVVFEPGPSRYLSAIVYGYAYNEHWLWFNNYTIICLSSFGKTTTVTPGLH